MHLITKVAVKDVCRQGHRDIGDLVESPFISSVWFHVLCRSYFRISIVSLSSSSSSSYSYHVERKSCRGKTPVSRRGISSSSVAGGGTGSDLFIVGVAMIAEKFGKNILWRIISE